MDYIIAVTLFAISASATPGPNNLLLMSSGVSFGVRRSLPLMCGICFGFALMLFLVGIGFGQIFQQFPELHFIIKCVGTVYLLYLAYLISRSEELDSTGCDAKPLSFLKGALFQWVNAKVWVVATGAIAAFTTLGDSYYAQNLTIALTFFIISFPSVGIWLLFGSALNKVLTSSKRRALFNYTMSGLLVLSVLPVLFELFSTLK
ncbi:LysE family translocator [Enterovibrio nigricans]|uniref:Threonine/homoserine/homoserine lactone efflux protein n=1 Tax=Enterovibrio nigricans DSM 22720 TaxID=1121868 RepID=A0A1T4V0P9_9GAMM|nr:LysE family translocator [Enterovibrio nigricans]SKA58474.1 Threonine/homoserine/homoserine lactone efflux protein [Enterovibrio nigricans DSM 22720]